MWKFKDHIWHQRKECSFPGHLKFKTLFRTYLKHSTFFRLPGYCHRRSPVTGSSWESRIASRIDRSGEAAVSAHRSVRSSVHPHRIQLSCLSPQMRSTVDEKSVLTERSHCFTKDFTLQHQLNHVLNVFLPTVSRAKRIHTVDGRKKERNDSSKHVFVELCRGRARSLARAAGSRFSLTESLSPPEKGQNTRLT